MVTFPHEWGVDMFRTRPDLATLLLSRYPGLHLPPGLSTEVTDPSTVGINLPDWQADAVILFRRRDRKIVYALIVEVQLRPDRKHKPYRWPQHAAIVRGRHRCPADVLVICVDDVTAAWAAQPIVTGLTGSQQCPVVIGPRDFPRVVDSRLAEQVPALAALSLASHPDDRDVARAVLAARRHIQREDQNQADVYHDFVLKVLTASGRKLLKEELMLSTEGYVFQSAFARRNIAKGRAEGRIEGRAEGRAETLLIALERLQFTVTDADRERILSCTDPDVLELWLRRAFGAKTTQEIFA